MNVTMFQPRFAALVEAGTKRQTVRPTPERMPFAGDKRSLRQWLGKPYRSKQRELMQVTLKHVLPIKIHAEFIVLGGNSLFEDDASDLRCLNVFAKADGFTDWPEMRDWFDLTHGLPFTGILLEW